MRPQTGHVYTIFLERIKAKNHTNLVRLPPSISSLERGSQNPFKVHSCPRISDFAVCCTQLFQHLDDSELFMIGLLLILLHFEIIVLQNSNHFFGQREPVLAILYFWLSYFICIYHFYSHFGLHCKPKKDKNLKK